MKHQLLLNLFIKILIILLLAVPSYTQGKIVNGEILIQLDEGVSLDEFEISRSNTDLTISKYLSPSLNVYLVKYDTLKYDFSQISKNLTRNSKVKFYAQNKKVELRKSPNDQHFGKQWNLQQIEIEKAWNVTTGGKTALGDDIVVAILDSGYDIGLPDLFNNVAINSDESKGDKNLDGCPGNCDVDDDGDGLVDEDGFGREPSHVLYNPSFKDDDDENGYIDDILGLNLADNTDEHPAQNHGTAVAGIIGALGDNSIGVSGINWDINLLLLSKVSNVGQIIEAYQYVYDKRRIYNLTNGEKGAYIVATNFSSGIDNEFGSDFPVWCNMYDLLGSEGVLSVGATTNKHTNVDIEGDMPTTCSSPYLITVTNLTRDDNLAIAGFGSENIDLGAPGNGAITLGLGETDNVGEFSGTSSATPHVSGAIALLHSIPCEDFAQYFKDNPANVIDLKEHIMISVDPVSDLVGKSQSEGRLNVFSTMKSLKGYCPGESGGNLEILKIFPNPSYRDVLNLEYNGPDDEEFFGVSIYNIIGELIYTFNFPPPLYGERYVTFRPPELTSGTYIITLRSAEEIVSRKHIILPY